MVSAAAAATRRGRRAEVRLRDLHGHERQLLARGAHHGLRASPAGQCGRAGVPGHSGDRGRSPGGPLRAVRPRPGGPGDPPPPPPLSDQAARAVRLHPSPRAPPGQGRSYWRRLRARGAPGRRRAPAPALRPPLHPSPARRDTQRAKGALRRAGCPRAADPSRPGDRGVGLAPCLRSRLPTRAADTGPYHGPGQGRSEQPRHQRLRDPCRALAARVRRHRARPGASGNPATRSGHVGMAGSAVPDRTVVRGLDLHRRPLLRARGLPRARGALRHALCRGEAVALPPPGLPQAVRPVRGFQALVRHLRRDGARGLPWLAEAPQDPYDPRTDRRHSAGGDVGRRERRGIAA